MFSSNKTSSERPDPNRRRSGYHQLRYHPDTVCKWPDCTNFRSQTEMCVKHFGMEVNPSPPPEPELKLVGRNYCGSRLSIYASDRGLRTPSWANKKKIARVYEICRIISDDTGIPHEVDHIIPLQGKNISGLHVHENLQILLKSENRAKSNKFPTPS